MQKLLFRIILLLIILSTAQTVHAVNWYVFPNTKPQISLDTDSIKSPLEFHVYTLWYKKTYSDGSYTMQEAVYDKDYRLYCPTSYVSYDKNGKIVSTFVQIVRHNSGQRITLPKIAFSVYYDENGGFNNAMAFRDPPKSLKFRPIIPDTQEEALYNMVDKILIQRQEKFEKRQKAEKTSCKKDRKSFSVSKFP